MNPVEWIALAILVLMFIVATKWPINIGLMGFAASFFVGWYLLGLNDKKILEEFPATIVLTILGVTFFFSLAQKNGTIDLVVRSAISAVRGRDWLIPWMFFLVASGLTALGTFSPAAVALLAPAAMTFCAAKGYNGVVMGAMVINGAHAGGFSPISVAGVLVRDLAAKNGFPINPIELFWAAYAVNLILTILTVLAMAALKRLHRAPSPDIAAEVEDAKSAPVTWRQWLTLALIVVMIVAALGFKLPIGFVGLSCGLVLAFTMMDQHKTFVSGISWSTILLVSGMIVYISMLTDAGVIDSLSGMAVMMGIPIVVALVLCYVIGISSAFASSTALLTAFIPLAGPLLASSGMSATAVVSAMAISATIVDVSPFSTDGALIIANAQGEDAKTIWRDLLVYAAIVVAVAPLLAWALFVPTGIL